MQSELETLCDNFLVDNLRPGLKQAVDDLIAKGATPIQAYAFVERCIRRRQQESGTREGDLTLLQVEAYLDRHHGTTFGEDRKADSLGYPRRKKS